MSKNIYKAFLSSTYKDLKDVRQEVISSILTKRHLPIAMEYFGPGSKPVWETIRAKMDECQFYVLIISGKYGSEKGGKSYSELEFEYAIKRRMPVIAVIPANLKALPLELQETGVVKHKKLSNFIRRVEDSGARITKRWTDLSNIPQIISDGLANEITDFERSYRSLSYKKCSGYLISLDKILGVNNIFTDMVKDAKSIKMLGRIANIIIKGQQPVIKEAVSSGCELNIAVLDPNSDAKGKIYGADVSEFEIDYNNMFKNVKKINDKTTSKKRGKVVLKTNEFPARSGLMIIEKKKLAESFAIIQLDVNSYDFSFRPLVCVNHADELFEKLSEDFNEYFTHATSTSVPL